jgi:hypothetical protein
VLIDCLRHADSWVLAQACAELMGDAGSTSFIRKVEKQFHSDLFEEDNLILQTKLAYTFSLSGLLWTVPVMLDVYERAADDDDAVIIPILLSHVLEPRFGPIASRNRAVSLPDYRKMVMGKYTELLSQFGSENTSIYYAQTFNVRGLASRLYDHLRGSEIIDVIVARDRHRFEAATGVDCRDFFQEGKLQVLAAAAILEEFLESPAAAMYEDGVRYFFGHRIPD